MAKRKTTSRKKNNKQKAPEHVVPDGFWRQVGAVSLGVIAILLVVAMADAGGPVLDWFYGVALSLIGWAVYLLPLIFVYLAIEIFRAENNKLPIVMQFATFLLVAWAAGFVQLFLDDPLSLEAAQNGEGGGFVGWVVAQAMLAMVGVKMAGVILAVLAVITSLFVLRVSPKSVIDAIKAMFGREDASAAHNQAVAAKAAAMDSAPIGELKLNEGVPIITAEERKSMNAPKKFGGMERFEEPQTALTMANDPDWEVPSLELLEKKQSPADAGDVKGNAQIIRDTLAEFSIGVEMEGANIGPKVTQYTLKPPSGVKLARITALENNIALNLAAQSLRIEAPIPGQRAVGIEVPNIKAADVRLYGILNSKQWRTASANSQLCFAIGKDIAGEPIVGELEKMPHLLIAGQTGSGKSVMINTLLSSFLYNNSPSNLKLILVDPKQVEMSHYQDIPHLLTPVITEPEKCISALKWAVHEMERRYSLLAEKKHRNIKSYNDANKEATMPYIVVVIDELADLMSVASRDVEALIVRLAQKARAVGIHLVLATQRPSVDVITGLIKANIPARIAFTVASQIDSRTILDQNGAEKLLGQGDMLLLTPDMNKPKRIQGAFVSDSEVDKVTEFLRMQRPPEYDTEVVAQPVQLSGKGGIVMDFDAGDSDPLYRDAVRVVIEGGKASASMLQRRLRLGYARAARIIETMEEQGIVGPADGARPREVLVGSLDEVFGGGETTEEDV